MRGLIKKDFPMRAILNLLLIAGTILSTSSVLRAQASNVRDCAPVLTKDYYSYAMKNNLQEDYLRSIDEGDYAQAKTDITSKGQAYGGAFSGENDYNKFDESRHTYLENLHYSRSQQQAIDILQITTSDRAYGAYEACLRTIATGPALLVWASRETMNDIELRVKYINGANVKEIELIGTVKGGSVDGQPTGMIWNKGPWYSPFNGNKWGVNEEKSFTIKRSAGSSETTVTVKPSDGSSPFQQTFKRADAVLTLSYVGTTDALRGPRSVSGVTPNNNENKSDNCTNKSGKHGDYCQSRTTLTISTAQPRFLSDAVMGCSDPGNCGWLSMGPGSVSSDGLVATGYVDNWGSSMGVVLKANEYEHLSSTQCGGDYSVPVILSHPVLLTVVNECQPIAQIKWKTLVGIPSQGSLPFSKAMSPGGEVVMVGPVTTSGSVSLASYQLNKLGK